MSGAFRAAEPSSKYIVQREAPLIRGLNLLTMAPDGVAELRSLTRSLAVRGLMVNQETRDQSTSEVLATMRVERARLVQIGLAKPAKDPVLVHVAEQPYALPTNWRWVRLADVCSLVTDGEHATPQRCKDATAIPLVTAKNVRSERMDYARTDFVPRDVAAKCWLRCKPERGDILMVSVGATLGRLCVIREPVDMVLVRSVTLLRPLQVGVCADYLALHLMSSVSQREIWSEVKQSAQPGLYLAKTAALKIALPPLAEQHRIVARVDELMKLCDALAQSGRLADAQHARLTSTLFDALAASESAHALAENWQRIAAHLDLLLDRPEAIDALEQTILQLAVRGLLVPQVASDRPTRIATLKPKVAEAPYEVPLGWAWRTVESIATVGSGTTPSRTNAKYFDPPEVPWVTSGETGQPFIAVTAQAVSGLALRETTLKVYPIGALIVAMYGQGKTRGQIAELLLPATTNQACAAIVPTDPAVHHRRYIKLFFEKSYDELRSESVGGAQPNLNVGKIKSTLIPLPPLAEQHRIVARVEELRRLCAQLRERLTEARRTQSQLADALVAKVD